MSILFTCLRITLLFLFITYTFSCGNGASEKPNGDQSIPQSIPLPKNNRLFNLQKTKAELKDQIVQEFKSGIYIRQIRRFDDEIKYVIEKRIDIREGKEKPDDVEPYWVSVSVVRENLNIPLFDNAIKTGLVISNKAQLGYFSPYDAAAPTKTKKAAVNLRPPVSIFTQQMFTMADVGFANNLYTFADIKNLFNNMIAGTAPIPKAATGNLMAPVIASGDPVYNEALIYYSIEDVLGIWANSADDTEAKAFQAKIKTYYDTDFPLVKYNWRKINPGTILYNPANFTVDFSVN